MSVGEIIEVLMEIPRRVTGAKPISRRFTGRVMHIESENVSQGISIVGVQLLEGTYATSNNRDMKKMGHDSNGELPENPEQPRSLTKVLVQSEHVENLVKESAEELSTVNAGIKQALVNQGSVPGVENALEKSEAVEGKVSGCFRQAGSCESGTQG
jgi:hypothetical protein